jgi:hypothetical protein
MAGSNSESKNMEFYSLKAKVDETNEPYFAQSEKVNNKWENTKRFDTMNGVIVGASIEEKEFKAGEGKKRFFVLLMEENGTTAKVAMTHNQVTYGIINSIASGVDTLLPFSIKVYRDKPTTGENGKIYYNGKSFVKRNNQKTEWHVRMQDAPKKKPIMLEGGVQYKDPSGKPMFDASAVQAFWENIFKIAIVDKVGSGKPAATVNNNPAAAATNTGNNNSFIPNSQEDDLPF